MLLDEARSHLSQLRTLPVAIPGAVGAKNSSCVPETEATGGQFIFGMGQSANLSDYIYIPILDHLSFGLHYWF